MDIDENVSVTRPKAPAKPGQKAEVYKFLFFIRLFSFITKKRDLK